VLDKQVTLNLKKKSKGIKKLLLFDLDETLAHCVRVEIPNQPPDVRLNITTQSGKVLNAGFNVRRYTKEMLTEVNKYYEVAVFTASHKWYADVILDYIDPQNIFFQHRLYRESCIKTTDNVYIKDLRVIKNVSMKDMILVDNAIYSFGLQLSNGIPITPFKHNKTDEEFLYLWKFLIDCHDIYDLRETLKLSFHFEELSKEYNFDDFIDYYDYEDCEEEQEKDDDFEHQLIENHKRGLLPPSTGPPPSSPHSPHKSSGLAQSVNHALDGIQKYMSKSIEDKLNK